MKIKIVELLCKDLAAQYDFYTRVLELPASLSAGRLEVQAGESQLVFTQAPADFDGAYHFAFNIPSNQFQASRAWLTRRARLLVDVDGVDEFRSESWNSDSLYFKDAAGNVLEFIARHALPNDTDLPFESRQLLNVSEIGLAAEDVLALAQEFTSRLGLAVFKQEPSPTFTPLGDDDGLLILPVQGRMWFPNSGVLAQLLPVRVVLEVNGQLVTIRGVPYAVET